MELDSISREIRFWWIDKHIHLSAAHVPGKDNDEADQESRSENDNTEWYLSENVFNSIYISWVNCLSVCISNKSQIGKNFDVARRQTKMHWL